MDSEELIDFVKDELTMSGALPDYLPRKEVQRLIDEYACPWFYRNYQHAVQRAYYIVPRESVKTDQETKYKYIQLPDEVFNIAWVYQLRNRALFELGVQAPNLSVHLGVTNQPYLNSFTSTIGELGMYKTVIDGFADVLNMLSKWTTKFHFNFNSKKLNILTSLNTDLVLETNVMIPPEDLYENDLFKKYVVGLSRKQLGRLLTRYSFNLPGGVTINGDQLVTEGEEERKAVEDEIKSESTSAWFIMAKK